MKYVTMSAAGVFAAALLAACAGPYHYADPAKPHRAADRFVNWGGGAPTEVTPWYEALVRRLRGDFSAERPPEGGYGAFAERWRVPLDVSRWPTSADGPPQVAWLGHASVLLRLGGKNILVDPQFSDFAGPVSWLSSRRRVAPPVLPEQLPPIDLLLITHNHYDHLDEPTLARLWAAGQRPRVLVPLGLKAWFDDLGWSGVEELDWWEERRSEALTVTLLPAKHWSKRTLTDANQTLWGGWSVQWTRPAGAAPWRFVHTGDTAYRPELHEAIARHLGAPVDLLAVPIGAYQPRDFMRRYHADPDEAVRILQALDARQAFGIHWGTFELSHEPFDQPPRDLAKALDRHALGAERVWLLRQGEVRAAP